MTTVHKDEKVFQGSGGSLNGGLVCDNFTISTADATATVIKRIPLAQGEAVIVRAFVAGKKTDLSAVAGINQWAVFRRAAAGNVTLAGSVQGTTVEDSAGAPVIALSANTTAQSVDLSVTGIAAESWKWEARVEYMKI
jgi:hypothetical protein